MTDNLKTQEIDALLPIANQFIQVGKAIALQPLGNGNINDTFLVTLEGLPDKHFVLQRINTQVFPQPELVMHNIRTFVDRVRQRLRETPLDRRWEVPQVLLTQANQDYFKDANGSFWRAIGFIENAESFETMQTVEQAREVGYALGTFHHLIDDLPPEKLADTLPGFHITPLYLRQYERVLETSNPPASPEVNYCLQFVRDRAEWAHCLEDAKENGKLPLRLMHGDPKVNNVMFDRATHQAVSVIDLDTVKPGLVHYDIGDCLRSGCNRAGEETHDWESVAFDPDLCQAILQGYLAIARSFLTDNDYLYLYDAIRLIAFELGLRFFSDYLAGNVYFKVKYPEHNLARAMVQFKLTESIESQERIIRAICDRRSL